MFIDLKNKLNEMDIQALLGYSVFPDPDRLEGTIEAYRKYEDWKLAGFEVDGEVIGLVGYELSASKQLEIKHLSVHPKYRGEGYGRGLILELIEQENPTEIIAVIDEEVTDFYRNIGFTIESLGEVFPGVERYRCVYVV